MEQICFVYKLERLQMDVAGVIYTSKKSVLAQHGGAHKDDTNVALLVVDPLRTFTHLEHELCLHHAGQSQLLRCPYRQLHAERSLHIIYLQLLSR